MNTPGCFGLGVIHSKSPTCRACEHRSACRSTALETLKQVNEEVAIPQLLKHYSDIEVSESSSSSSEPSVNHPSIRVDLTAHQQATFEALPKKAKLIAQSMESRGIPIGKSLASGCNPFAKTRSKFLEVAADLYLSGSFSRDRLEGEFKQRFPQWSKRTLRSQISIAESLIRIEES